MPTRFVLEPNVTGRMARAAPVQQELNRQQSRIAQRASGNLGAVRDRGRHRITTSRGSVDRYINLVGPAALSLETGHFTRGGTRVAGRNILRNA